MPQYNEVMNPHQPVQWEDDMSETTMTARDWLTSDKPEAAQWRKEANMDAFNRVYDQAKREQPGKHITIPATPITRPPTKINRFFQIPEEAPPAHVSAYFTIPGDK